MADYVSYMRDMIGNKPMFLVGAGVIIKDSDNKILFIRRTDNGKWGLPGGSLELGETFEDAALREVLEETGIKAFDLKLFRVFSGEKMRFVYPNGDEVYNAVCIFETEKFIGKPKGDGIESSTAGFFSSERLPEPLHPPDALIIDEYLRRNQ